MGVVKVFEYGKIYPTLTNKLKENSESEYEFLLSLILAEEFNSGFRVKSVNNPTKSGTKIKFEAFKDEDEAKKYREQLTERLEEARLEFDSNWQNRL